MQVLALIPTILVAFAFFLDFRQQLLRNKNATALLRKI